MGKSVGRAFGSLISPSPSVTDQETETQRETGTSPEFQSKSEADSDLLLAPFFSCPLLGVVRSGANSHEVTMMEDVRPWGSQRKRPE